MMAKTLQQTKGMEGVTSSAEGNEAVVQGVVMQSALRSTDSKKKTPWSESASELYRPSDRRLSTKLVPPFTDRGCHVVSVTDPSGRILAFLDRSRYFSIK
jgi:hypothetical protein